jgi:hypothetical protein
MGLYVSQMKLHHHFKGSIRIESGKSGTGVHVLIPQDFWIQN